MPYLQNSFFEAAILAFTGIEEGHLPALGVSIALVHAHQVCCPQGCLVPTCACPHLNPSQQPSCHALCHAGGGRRGGGKGLRTATLHADPQLGQSNIRHCLQPSQFWWCLIQRGRHNLCFLLLHWTALESPFSHHINVSAFSFVCNSVCCCTVRPETCLPLL